MHLWSQLLRRKVEVGGLLGPKRLRAVSHDHATELQPRQQSETLSQKKKKEKEKKEEEEEEEKRRVLIRMPGVEKQE